MFNRIAEYRRLVARPSAPWGRRSPAQISDKACGTFGPLSWRSHSPHCRHNLRSTRSSGSKKHSSLVFTATFWGWKSIRVRTRHNQLVKIHNWPDWQFVMSHDSKSPERRCWPWSVNPLIVQNRQQVPAALHPCPHVQVLQINASMKWILCHLCFLSFLGALWRHLMLSHELFNFFDIWENLTWAQAQWVHADDLMRLTPSILPHTNKGQ